MPEMAKRHKGGLEMRVQIKTGFDKERCLECNKSIRTGQQYTIHRVSLTSLAGLNMNYRLRSKHYPTCEKPGMWEDGLIKERVGYKG